MDLFSLPPFRSLHAQSAVPRIVTSAGEPISLRGSYRLRDLLLLVAVAVLFHWLAKTTAAIERPAPGPEPQVPLVFSLVEERFGKVHVLATREEVEELLGPPSPTNATWEADLAAWEALAERSLRDVDMPGDRWWALWIDPKDSGRGVAILFAGGKVRHVARKGF